ncbi:MAG: hypothetical protein WCJ85_12775 [Chitinophagaceae bacterium]
MHKLLLSCFFLAITLSLVAQKDKFDIASYTPPTGWKKVSKPEFVFYEISNKTTKSWSQIYVYKSITSTGDIDADFNKDWQLLAAKAFDITEEPTVTEVVEQEGWKIKSGSGKFTFQNKPCSISITTISGFNVSICIQANMNSADYLDDVVTLIGSLDLVKPNNVVATNNPPINNPSINPTKSSGFAFTTTNFDDGWIGTVKEDWVEVSKDNIKVLLHYPNKIADEYNTVLRDQDNTAWNTLVAPHYNNLKNFQWRTIQSWESISFMEGDLEEKATGKNVHVVLFKKHYNSGKGRYLEFVADSKATIEAAFGAYHNTTSDWDKYANMQWHNKFAIGAGDLIGKWSSNDYASLSYYYVNTGASAGTTTTSTANLFHFISNSNYESEHNGASGMVGNMKFSNQEYKGKYSLTNWDITMTNRFQGASEKFSSYFEAIKGGRILILINHLGTVYSLVRQ